MRAMNVANTVSENPKAGYSTSSKEYLIIIAIVVLGLIGMSTCLIGDTSDQQEFTIQKVGYSITSLN